MANLYKIKKRLFVALIGLSFLLGGCNRPIDLTGTWKLDSEKTTSSESLKKWTDYLKDNYNEKIAENYKKVIESTGIALNSIEIKDNKFLFGGLSCEIVKFSKTEGARCKDLETNKQKYLGFEVESGELYLYLTPTLPPFIYKK
jgi:hypothetical protein